MSADNFISVRKFGEKDYRWGNFSDSGCYKAGVSPRDSEFDSKPFESEDEALMNAYEELSIVEYGHCPDNDETWGIYPELDD